MNNKVESAKFFTFFIALQEFKGTVDEVFDSVSLSAPIGLENTEIAVTKKDGKIVIIFSHNNEMKCYTPTTIEMATKDYDTDGKEMRSYKVDNSFWFFEERLPGAARPYASYGTDMKANFIKQQNWEDATKII